MQRLNRIETAIANFFLHQWQRKCVAFLTAAVIWLFVNHTITATKTIPSVPIRVINLPVDKTIPGLLPNGFLGKRTTLTVMGTKDVVEQLEVGDLEVILDVSNQTSDGIVQITKKNLISLNPDINLANHITSVSHPEFIIKLSTMVTDKIPITIHSPRGEAPKGYQYLGVWPVKLMQTVSGAQELVAELKAKGLELNFNLNDITKEQLDALHASQTGLYDDEVSFMVPEAWKKIVIPFLSPTPESLNDPAAKYLQIDFLKQAPLSIKSELPLYVFYPLKYSATINPQTHALALNAFIQSKNNIPVLKLPLFAQSVSKLFLEIVKDNLEIEIVAAPKSEREKLEWSIGFIDMPHLEDTYVAFLLSHAKNSHLPDKEKYLRKRFRGYTQRLSLFVAPNRPLELECTLEENQINVQIAPLISKPKVNNGS